MTTASRLGSAAAVLALLAAWPEAARAEAPAAPLPGVIQRWGLSVGGYLTQFDTSVSWSTADGALNPFFRLEDTLGLDEEITRWRFAATWRTGQRWLMDVDYVRLRRSAERTLLRQEVQIGDKVYNIGALVESDFDTDIYKLGFTWHFVSRPRVRIGLIAGISAFDLSGSIRGIATAQGAPGDPEFREEEREDLVAPVPLLGLSAGFNLTRRLLLRGHGQIFDLEAGKWDAEVVDTAVLLEYMVTDHVALGAGYDYYDLRYRQEKDSLAVKYRFDGLVAFVRLVY